MLLPKASNGPLPMLVPVPHNTVRDAYLRCAERLQELRSHLEALQHAVTVAHEGIASLEPVLIELQKYVCLSCHGLGSTRRFSAQDESEVTVCIICGGTGLRKA